MNDGMYTRKEIFYTVTVRKYLGIKKYAYFLNELQVINTEFESSIFG